MPKYFFSECLIVKDESPYVAEHLEFHLLQGCEHFYVYDNESSDDTPEKLIPYIEQGLVTLVNWPGKSQQCKAYEHCLETYGKDSEWMAFLDTDEFLYLKDGRPFATYLERQNNIVNLAGIAVRWILFGSNDHLEKTDGLVIERFTKRAEKSDRHCKSVVRPRGIKRAGENPHQFKPKPGYSILEEKGLKLPLHYAVMSYQTADELAIAHYHTKSRAEYFKRKENPDANSGFIPNKTCLETMFHAHNLNEAEDLHLKNKYAETIKANIRQRYA